MEKDAKNLRTDSFQNRGIRRDVHHSCRPTLRSHCTAI